MEPNTIFLLTAGAVATATAGVALHTTWKGHIEAVNEARESRFALDRAERANDQLIDRIDQMNRTIAQLRSDIKTARAEKAVVEIDLQRERNKRPRSTRQSQLPLVDETGRQIQSSQKLAPFKRSARSNLWNVKQGHKQYTLRFISNSVIEWTAHVSPEVIKTAYRRNKTVKTYMQRSGTLDQTRFAMVVDRVMYCTTYFETMQQALDFKQHLFEAYGYTVNIKEQP